jgi:hypothetical protein
MAELRGMGMEDIPVYKGMSSSMRQLAWVIVGIKLLPAEEQKEEIVFVTTDSKILGLKESIKAKFGITICDMMEIAQRIKNEKNCIS